LFEVGLQADRLGLVNIFLLGFKPASSAAVAMVKLSLWFNRSAAII
jgi:hypothetical protein